MTFNCAACAEPHSPHHKIHFKKGRHQSNFNKKLMPPGLHTVVLLFTTGGALPPFKFNRQDRLLWIPEMRLRVVRLSFYHFRLGGILEFSHNQ